MFKIPDEATGQFKKARDARRAARDKAHAEVVSAALLSLAAYASRTGDDASARYFERVHVNGRAAMRKGVPAADAFRSQARTTK